MKIIKNLLFVVCLCVILLCLILLIPIQHQIDADYDVTIYDLDSEEKLQFMGAHVFGTYKHYLFYINGYSRFEGKIEIIDESGESQVYENVIIDLNNGAGALCYIDRSGNINIIGSFTETRNPIKNGKIILPQYYDGCYAVYETHSAER